MRRVALRFSCTSVTMQILFLHDRTRKQRTITRFFLTCISTLYKSVRNDFFHRRPAGPPADEGFDTSNECDGKKKGTTEVWQWQTDVY